MAEFQEVMKQISRYCKAQYGCAKCELYDVTEDHCPSDLFAAGDNGANIEKLVMAWAAEHPESVYPTFAEWMYDSFLKWCQGNYPGRAKDEKAWYDYIYETRIPADIAEKLGLQPKEGT